MIKEGRDPENQVGDRTSGQIRPFCFIKSYAY
jgi:hypothetical protein